MPSKQVTTEAPNTAVLESKVAELEEKLKLLQFLADRVDQEKKDDFFTIQSRAQEIREKSMNTCLGSVTWSVTVPGQYHPIIFQCDEERESGAIREFETRFGTRFVTNSQRDEDNHKIERVDT